MTIRARKLASGKTTYDVEVYCEDRDARGRRRKISRTVTTKQEAIKLEASLKVEAEGGGVRDSRRTVEDLITEWLRHKESEGRSPSTIANYRSMAERDIIPSLGSLKLDKLGPRHLEKLYASMRARGLATNTIRNTHVPFKGALDCAVRWGWMPYNPADKVVMGRSGGVQGRAASMEEVEALLAAADPEMRLVVRLAAVTGMRRSELLGLRWDDVDFDKGEVTIRRSVIDVAGKAVARDTTKNHHARTLDLDEVTVSMLRQHRGIGPIINLAPSVLSKRFRALCASVGIEGAGLHALRHFCATFLLVDQGHDVRTVAGRLGHRDASVTLNTYAHQLRANDRAAADAMGKALGLHS